MSSLHSRKKESYKIFDQIAPTYDSLNHLLSFGIDVYWRKQMMKVLPQGENLQALDLACGTGDVSIVLGRQKKVGSVEGLDLSEGMISHGREKIATKGLSEKVKLEIGDGVTIPRPDNSVDVVTLTFGVRNFSDPKVSLQNIYRVLKPGGRGMVLEFSIPANPVVRWIYFFYFRYVLPFVGNLLSGHGDAYTYLNKTVEDFPYGEEFADWMRQAGFRDVKYRVLTFGIATLYWGDKPFEK